MPKRRSSYRKVTTVTKTPYLGAGIVAGRGDYSNSLYKAGGVTGVPTFGRVETSGALSITHREYICDIDGTTGFTLQNWLVTPSNESLFPWLSQIASNYDEFEFIGLVFTFKSVTADITGSGQIGTVMMACNYNAGAPLFTNKQQMLEYDCATSVKITNDLLYGIECDPRKNALGPILYVPPNGTIPTGEDIKTYCLGNLQLATNGCQNQSEIGELWVSYQLQLRKPKMFESLGNTINQVNFTSYCTNYSNFVSPGSVSTSLSNGFLNTSDFTIVFPNSSPISNITSVNDSCNDNIIKFYNVSTSAHLSSQIRMPDSLGAGAYSLTVQFNTVLGSTIPTASTSSNCQVSQALDFNSTAGTYYMKLYFLITESAISAGLVGGGSASANQGTFLNFVLSATSNGYCYFSFAQADYNTVQIIVNNPSVILL